MLCMHHLHYDDMYQDWIQSSPIGKGAFITQLDRRINWFSLPEVAEEEHDPWIVKCLDGHHLLCNLRSKVCKDGVHGIRKEAWHDVARHDSSIISQSLVIDLIDKQRNSYARRTFSPEVESCMRLLGYSKEADFVQLVRHWYEAEDDRSVDAVKRAESRLAFRDFLVEDVSFQMFPPSGMYIKGFPRVMYEGFLSSIDSHMQLYITTRNQCYNQRAFSSLENESFFGNLSEMDPTKLGCPKAVNIPRLMANVSEVLHYRQDPTSRYDGM